MAVIKFDTSVVNEGISIYESIMMGGSLFVFRGVCRIIHLSNVNLCMTAWLEIRY